MSGVGIHLPNPSYWPLMAAIGIALVFIALQMLPRLGPLGVVVAVLFLFFSVFKWAFEQAG